MPHYIAFIDLTKVCDLVSRKGLFYLLKKIGCPSQLLSITVSFHGDMKGAISYDDKVSESFLMQRGVKQGYVLAPTLFYLAYVSSLLLNFAVRKST